MMQPPNTVTCYTGTWQIVLRVMILFQMDLFRNHSITRNVFKNTLTAVNMEKAGLNLRHGQKRHRNGPCLYYALQCIALLLAGVN